jgi:hypothetical protein
MADHHGRQRLSSANVRLLLPTMALPTNLPAKPTSSTMLAQGPTAAGAALR